MGSEASVPIGSSMAIGSGLSSAPSSLPSSIGSVVSSKLSLTILQKYSNVCWNADVSIYIEYDKAKGDKLSSHKREILVIKHKTNSYLVIEWKEDGLKASELNESKLSTVGKYNRRLSKSAKLSEVILKTCNIVDGKEYNAHSFNSSHFISEMEAHF